jgi:DNA-binding CsgD family transcriptional regulator
VNDGAAVLAEAQTAAESGDWERVVTLLAELAPVDRDQQVAVAFLNARAALHADVPARALDSLDGLADIVARPDEQITATILRGEALGALDRHDEGLTLLDGAAAAAVGDRRHEALLALAQSLWRAERIDAIGPALDGILSAGAVSAAPAPILARAYELYGRLELRRFRRPIAARHFRDALDALSWSPRSEPQLRAGLLHALLAIAIETLDLHLLERVRSEIHETDWHDPALRARQRALQPLLALGALLLGESTAAWDIGFRLRADALPGPQQIVADVTAAEVARTAGDAWTPAQLIGKAASFGAQVAWSETGAAGGRALLTLIAEVAGAAPDAARALLAAYEALPARASWARAEDTSDLVPLEFFARAAIHGAEGNARAQETHLRSAIARWHEVGNAYGELRASLTLAQLTGDAAALARADELTRLVPRSWLRGRCATLAERAQDVLTLSPAEHRVMLALLEGLSGMEIATKFGRSKNTIRNQTKRVFEAMGVRSRSGLVARCAALGLSTPEKRP